MKMLCKNNYANLLFVFTLLLSFIIFCSFYVFSENIQEKLIDKSTPEFAAYTFLNAMNNANYEAAKSVSTTETKKFLDVVSTFSNMIPDSVTVKARANIVSIKDNTKIIGNKATISYSKSIKNEIKQLQLLKQDGQWLVVQTKDAADD